MTVVEGNIVDYLYSAVDKLTRYIIDLHISIEYIVRVYYG